MRLTTVRCYRVVHATDVVFPHRLCAIDAFVDEAIKQIALEGSRGACDEYVIARRLNACPAARLLSESLLELARGRASHQRLSSTGDRTEGAHMEVPRQHPLRRLRSLHSERTRRSARVRTRSQFTVLPYAHSRVLPDASQEDEDREDSTKVSHILHALCPPSVARKQRGVVSRFACPRNTRRQGI